MRLQSAVLQRLASTVGAAPPEGHEVAPAPGHGREPVHLVPLRAGPRPPPPPPRTNNSQNFKKKNVQKIKQKICFENYSPPRTNNFQNIIKTCSKNQTKNFAAAALDFGPPARANFRRSSCPCAGSRRRPPRRRAPGPPALPSWWSGIFVSVSFHLCVRIFSWSCVVLAGGHQVHLPARASERGTMKISIPKINGKFSIASRVRIFAWSGGHQVHLPARASERGTCRAATARRARSAQAETSSAPRLCLRDRSREERF